jgi:hypothetical protein
LVELEHPLGGLFGILMLPDAEHPPPKLAQTPVGVLVSFHVLANLTSPPFHVGLGSSAVGGAVVPEATVDKDSKTRPSKDDVDRAIGPRNQSLLDLKPKSPTMQCRAKQTIYAIIHPSSRCHSSGSLRG